MENMKGYLPDDWESIIKPVNKLASAGNTSSTIETVSDKLFLLAEIEVFGSATYSVSGEGTQYAYYKAGNSKVKNKGGYAKKWFERSPVHGNKYSFCCVGATGVATYNDSFEPYGVAFGFCV